MLDVSYESGAGVVIALNSGVYVGRPNDLFSREWDYKIGYRALATASRGARKASFKAFFADMAQADAFRRCADADMQKGMPGTLRVEGWFQRCFVVASEVDCIGSGFFMAKLTLVLLDGVWRRESTTAFSQVNWSADYEYLDLPYDLPYDLGATPPQAYATNPGHSDSPAKCPKAGELKSTRCAARLPRSCRTVRESTHSARPTGATERARASTSSSACPLARLKSRGTTASASTSPCTRRRASRHGLSGA